MPYTIEFGCLMVPMNYLGKHNLYQHSLTKLDFMKAVLSIDDATAQRLVSDLVDADVVTPVPEDRVLVHEPSGTAFDSSTQLAVFHRGWTAGRDADEEAE